MATNKPEPCQRMWHSVKFYFTCICRLHCCMLMPMLCVLCVSTSTHSAVSWIQIKRANSIEIHINKFGSFLLHSHPLSRHIRHTIRLHHATHTLAYHWNFSRPLTCNIAHSRPNTTLWPQSIHWFRFDGNKSLSFASKRRYSNSIFDSAYRSTVSKWIIFAVRSLQGNWIKSKNAVNRIVFYCSAFHYTILYTLRKIHHMFRKTWSTRRSAPLILIYWLQHIRIRP